jgi:XTP/dITP diphosphohydrolase
MRLRFLSSNPLKVAEVEAILGLTSVDVIPVARKVEEIQSPDIEMLVRDKCIRAFRLIGRPVFVEHTGLYIDALNGFPGGLTQIFWDTVGAEQVSRLFGALDRSGAVARTHIGYCDGCRVHRFEGEVRGRIAPEPRGEADRQWDRVFVPDGEERTFAEMGEAKNEVSMRRRALDALVRFLEEGRDAR